jgi:hypothetical protein
MLLRLPRGLIRAGQIGYSARRAHALQRLEHDSDAANDEHRVPEDVRAKQDTDERRRRAEPVLGDALEELPEDVIGERDREARRAGQDMLDRRVEGRPPAEEGPRS